MLKKDQKYLLMQIKILGTIHSRSGEFFENFLKTLITTAETTGYLFFMTNSKCDSTNNNS